MNKAILFLVSLSMIASAQVPSTIPSVSKWQISNTIKGNHSEQVCTFTLNHDDLTGECNSEKETLKINGKVAGKNISWTYHAKHGFMTLTVVHNGAIDSSKITGTVKVDPFGVDGSFTGYPIK
jgi:hypothetical protein